MVIELDVRWKCSKRDGGRLFNRIVEPLVVSSWWLEPPITNSGYPRGSYSRIRIATNAIFLLLSKNQF